MSDETPKVLEPPPSLGVRRGPESGCKIPGKFKCHSDPGRCSQAESTQQIQKEKFDSSQKYLKKIFFTIKKRTTVRALKKVFQFKNLTFKEKLMY